MSVSRCFINLKQGCKDTLTNTKSQSQNQQITNTFGMVNYDYDYASKQRMQLGRVCVQVLGHLSDAPYL